MTAEEVTEPAEIATTPATPSTPQTGFTMLGDPGSAPVCIDGVCELPTP